MKRLKWDEIESRDSSKLHLDRNEPQEWTWLHELIQASLEPTDFLEYPDLNQSYYHVSILESILPKNILLTSGADDALAQIFKLFSHSNVFMSDPTYKMAEVHARNYNCDVYKQPFKLKTSKYPDIFYELECPIPNVKCEINYFASPDNPTGQLHNPKLIEELLINGEVVIIDKTYQQFAENPTQKYERFLINPKYKLFIVNTISKTIGAGFKLGWIISHEQNIDNLRQHKLSYEISGIAAKALKCLANNRYAYYDLGVDTIKRKREIYELLRKLEIKFIHTHTNFVLIENSKLLKEIFDKYCYYKIIKIDGKEFIKLTVPGRKDLEIFKKKFEV